MKFLVLVLSLGAVVLARPDVSHIVNSGYHYKPPSTSYGVPVENKYPGTTYHQHHNHQVPSDSYGVPIDVKYSASGNSNLRIPSGGYLPGNIQYDLPHVQNTVSFAGGSTGSNYEGYNSQLIQDQKHVYYYAVPDDEEPAHLRIHVTASNKKNTNVIFVKAPSYAPVIPEVIVPEHQAPEKTKVIVLVKKPEQPAPIRIPAPVPVKSNPEVYIVKYDNQEEAERVLSGGRGGHPIGVNVHNLGNEASFVSALKTDLRKHIPKNDKYSGFDGNVNLYGPRSGVGAESSFVTGNLQSSVSAPEFFGARSNAVKNEDGSFKSFGVYTTGSEKSYKPEVVIEGGKKGFVEVVISNEKSGEDSNEGDGDSIKGAVSIKDAGEIKNVGQEFSSPLLDSFGKSAFESRNKAGTESESSLSGSITAGTERSSFVKTQAGGGPFNKYGPPSLSGPY